MRSRLHHNLTAPFPALAHLIHVEEDVVVVVVVVVAVVDGMAGIGRLRWVRLCLVNFVSYG